MNTWLAIVLGSLAVFSWKFLGYLLPARLLESKALSKLAGFLTISLLAGLVGVQTFTGGHQIEFDSRIPALLVAVVLLKLKAPFIVIVIAAGLTAALLRLAF
jgi:branched-subunit amino acid transport protein